MTSWSAPCTFWLLFFFEPELLFVDDFPLLLDEDNLLRDDSFLGSICCTGDDDDVDDEEFEFVFDERLESFMGSLWRTSPLDAANSLVALSKWVGTLGFESSPPLLLLLVLLLLSILLLPDWTVRDGGSEPVLFMMDLVGGDNVSSIPLPAGVGMDGIPSCVRPKSPKAIRRRFCSLLALRCGPPAVSSICGTLTLFNLLLDGSSLLLSTAFLSFFFTLPSFCFFSGWN